jgi:MarR family transcriptional regulator, organic hydroperoxide resistance regulator
VCFALSVAARSVVALYRRSARVGGLLARRRDPADERVLAVTLTDAGRGLRYEAEKVPAAIVARLGMEISDLENLHAALTQVIAAARED